MPKSTQYLKDSIRMATSPGFRSRLLEKGEARKLVWRDKGPNEDGPNFDPLLSYDLLSYGYSILGCGLELEETEGRSPLVVAAFESAAKAIESALTETTGSTQRDQFHRTLSAAAFHLAGFSARSYSVVNAVNASHMESIETRCLTLLITRDLNKLNSYITSVRSDPNVSDTYLASQLEAKAKSEDPTNFDACILDIVDQALTDTFLGAISAGMLAFERGDQELFDSAMIRLETGMEGASKLEMVDQWWLHKMASRLMRGLWESSIHNALPVIAPEGCYPEEWRTLRQAFVASLFKRQRAEIDLWPSQLEAVSKAVDTRENIVLSLPTSAGKTRVAEVCILRTLAERKRVVFITPLRSLSAQTEATLRRTFAPLGKLVSSLYGAIGLASFDASILEAYDIVVATPEKLDFALRTNPHILDNVGLIVFDEGHMIGESEREVRYEVQIQRLLRRNDAELRRIVCISAVLPQENRAEDFINWITRDNPQGLVYSAWRPTDLRFGEVKFENSVGRLEITVGSEHPFVPKFITPIVPSRGRRRNAFPKDNDRGELTLATAWRLSRDAKNVLIYCPQKKSVHSLAKLVVKLYDQGVITSLIKEDSQPLEKLISVGKEWLGEGHPVLRCLELGVAVHHGSLPTPYRKELESSLNSSSIRMIIASPTLAQGLNLSSGALVVHSLWRARSPIDPTEFRNVAGRAGRAFVDSVGLVIHPVTDKNDARNWRKVVENSHQKDMASGLVKLVLDLLSSLYKSQRFDSWETFYEYACNGISWSLIDAPDGGDLTPEEIRNWSDQLARLDVAVLTLLDESQTSIESLSEALDLALSSSLWSRTIQRMEQPMQVLLKAALNDRAIHVWNNTTPAQRRSCYLAGVGYVTVQYLSSHYEQLHASLLSAQKAITESDEDAAISELTNFAQIIFEVTPFSPKSMPENWQTILEDWLRGNPVSRIVGQDSNATIEFVEDALVYRLPWGIDAVRLHTLASTAGDLESGELPTAFGDIISSVEAGTLNTSAAFLIHAGFNSRSGALAAVTSTDANFDNYPELTFWINNIASVAAMSDPAWPTAESRQLWLEFARNYDSRDYIPWKHRVISKQASWHGDYFPRGGEAYRVTFEDTIAKLETPDAIIVGTLGSIGFISEPRGLLKAETGDGSGSVVIDYLGPEHLDW